MTQPADLPPWLTIKEPGLNEKIIEGELTLDEYSLVDPRPQDTPVFDELVRERHNW